MESAYSPAQHGFSVPADLLPHPSWVGGPEGTIDRWNSKWAEYTGRPAWSATGWGWLECVEPSNRDSVRSKWQDGIQEKQPFTVELSLWHERSRRWRAHVAHLVPNRDLADTVVGWYGTFVELPGPALVTEVDEEVAKARREVERVTEEMQQFAYSASHDLREPLRMVTSYLNLLERRYNDSLDPAAREYIAFAVDGSTRMTQLIDDLLAYSRVLGAPTGALRPVGMAGVVEWAKMNLAQEIAESGAAVQYDELPTVNADENRVVMAVQQILSNSLKFRNEAPPSIVIAAELKGSEWEIVISDNGIGFDQQYADRIFGVFKRLHGKQYPGSGMGLAIARKVVERHGGRIWAESTVGQGTRIHFTLPA